MEPTVVGDAEYSAHARLIYEPTMSSRHSIYEDVPRGETVNDARPSNDFMVPNTPILHSAYSKLSARYNTLGFHLVTGQV